MTRAEIDAELDAELDEWGEKPDPRLDKLENATGLLLYREWCTWRNSLRWVVRSHGGNMPVSSHRHRKRARKAMERIARGQIAELETLLSTVCMVNEAK